MADVWWLVSLGLAVLGTAAGTCCWRLRRDRERIAHLWEAISPLLRERCDLVQTLSGQMREVQHETARFVDDIDYLLDRVSETDDPYQHAGVQNGLVLTVQRALEDYHHSEQIRERMGIAGTINAIGGVDSRLAPLRDYYNRLTQRYNDQLKSRFSAIIARAMGGTTASSFPMLIPWWSTDTAAYGKITAEDIKHTLETWKAPMIVAPSQLAGKGEGGRRSSKEKPEGRAPQS